MHFEECSCELITASRLNSSRAILRGWILVIAGILISHGSLEIGCLVLTALRACAIIRIFFNFPSLLEQQRDDICPLALINSHRLSLSLSLSLFLSRILDDRARLHFRWQMDTSNGELLQDLPRKLILPVVSRRLPSKRKPSPASARPDSRA